MSEQFFATQGELHFFQINEGPRADSEVRYQAFEERHFLRDHFFPQIQTHERLGQLFWAWNGSKA